MLKTLLEHFLFCAVKAEKLIDAYVSIGLDFPYYLLSFHIKKMQNIGFFTTMLKNLCKSKKKNIIKKLKQIIQKLEKIKNVLKIEKNKKSNKNRKNYLKLEFKTVQII